ncbi:Extradiol aromatic ring-opening dioxygenase [Yamadazyma tenuis ATCC 10573]|nr:Extradiol aromatic ring-opening dioxygenase [Yamadazyma tenuis ATCC 10573]EGV63835.1 Extradiol aromatic ring-opening dioxygenase [Yamadazyma tenuis ATCC 10573]
MALMALKEKSLFATVKCKLPFPTYFISHGGPLLGDRNHFMTDKGAYDTLKAIGEEIIELKPDYLVVVSGHFQSDERDTIQISVNNAGKGYENKMIYDFYGFPDETYQQKFVSKSSPTLGLLVHEELTRSGFNAKIVDRGIDHGVWVPLRVAFGETLDIPLVEVSLPDSDSFSDSYKLGKALKNLRDELIWDPDTKKDIKGLIVCSGTSVHNLRDLQRSFSYPGQVMPYGKPFHELLQHTFEKSTPLTLAQNLNNLKKDANYSQLLYQAHPTLDHFLPFIVATGSNDGNSELETIYVNESFSLGWGMYKFNSRLKG